MYLITGAVGFLACIIFIVLIIIFAIRGKSGVLPLIGFILSIALFLGSGFLYSRTDPEIGGIRFVEYLTEDRTVPPNLEGEWKETVNDKADSFHGIYISGDTIEIYWVSDGGKSKTLYWAGTYTPPADGVEPYTWESHNDTRRTSAALLATGDSSKEFTYQNGKLSYSASVLGVTTLIKAERQPWGFLDSAENTDDTVSPAGEEPTLENAASGELGRFSVQLKSAALATDYDGNPAMVITYTWTNNSDTTISPLASVSVRALQDGEELAAAMILDGEVYNADTSISDARPGTSVNAQCAFTLTSETSPLTIELTELSGESDNVVSMEIDPASLAEQ